MAVPVPVLRNTHRGSTTTESDVGFYLSRQPCTEYGRAHNTDQLDATGAQRWMVYQDDERHYSVSCGVIADDEAAGTSAAYIHRRTDTFYEVAVTFDENNIKLTDGYPPQSRTYTSEAAASTFPERPSPPRRKHHHQVVGYFQTTDLGFLQYSDLPRRIFELAAAVQE
jgi:hypothetical protein